MDIANQLVETALNGMVAFDAEGRVTLWNRRMEQIVGLDRAEALGRKISRVIPGMHEADDDQAMRDAVAGVSGELILGQQVLTTRYLPVFGEDGCVVGGTATFLDITEHRQFEARVRESEGRFRIMADGAPAYLWMAGTDALCNYFNQAWLKFTGRTLEQELGYGWTEGIHPEDFQGCVDKYMQAFNRRQSFMMDYRLRRADGAYRWVLDNGIPRYLPGGAFAGYIGSCIDITERKAAEDAMHDRFDEHKRVSRLKDEFLATVSHELRTPLNIILGHAALLANDKQIPGEVRETAAVIQRHARIQTRLINDLLDASSLLSGKLPIDARPLDLGILVRESVEAMRLVPAAKHLSIETDIPNADVKVSGDSQRLQQALKNLLDNSIKFTPVQGRIVVRLTSDQKRATLLVTDTGRGIEPEFLPFVFERFHQEDGSIRRQFGGLGLGLAVVKEIVDLHGGQVRVKSPGRDLGTSFAVELPLL